MKLLIFIMAVAISYTVLAQPGSYTELEPSEYSNDQQIQALLHSGADNVVQQGIQSGRLPNSKFRVSRTFKVERQVVNGLNYRFDVELTNGQITLRAKYVVYLPAGSSTGKVTSSSFDITSASNEPVFLEASPDIPGRWSPVDLTELNTNPNLRNILNFGVKDVIAKGTVDGQLSGSTYYIGDVTSIERQVVSGENYRFSIVLGDDTGNEVGVTFTVYDQSWTGTREVTDYEFAENAEEGGEELLGSWESVDVSEAETNSDLRNILEYGLQYVVSQGVESGQLSNPYYQLAEAYSIQSQSERGMNYRFNLRLEDHQGGYATVIFIVYDVSWEIFPTREVTYLFLDIEDAMINEEGIEEDS